MIKKKKLTAGFVLSIIAATGILAIAIILESPNLYTNWHNLYDSNLSLCLIQLGIVVSIILLSVYGKKGGRAELVGLFIVSFLALFWVYSLGISLLSLIGSLLMLGALPKKLHGKTTEISADETDVESAQDEQAENAFVHTDCGHGPTESALTEGKTVTKKQGDLFQRLRKRFGKIGAHFGKTRARMCKEHASKLPAFLVLTVLFVAAFAAFLATYFRTDFIRIFVDTPKYIEYVLAKYGLKDSSFTLTFFLTLLIHIHEFFAPQFLWHVGDSWYIPSLTGDILPQLIFALIPVYLVYLGTHNPLKLPKGYAALLVMLGAFCFAQIDLMVIYNSVACAEYYLGGDNTAIGYLVYLLLASVICTQVASLFIFPYFLGEKTTSKAAIGVVLGTTLLLPLVISLVVAAVVVVLVVTLFVLFVVFILWLILLLLHVESDVGNPFAGAILEKPVETKEYTFTTDMGTSMTVYSQDGKRFYNSSGSYIGHSEDGGKTIIRD